MRQIAISFRKPPLLRAAPGRRYRYGEVSLGELREAFWSDTRVWSAAAYRRQWKAASKQCFASRRPVLLYTDVGVRASTAYHLVPMATGLLVFEQILRSSRRPLTDAGAVRDLIRNRKRLSCWIAPIAALRSLAARRC